MSKKTITIALTALNAFLIVMLVTQVLAATYINLSLNGNISYTATEIGAQMFVAQDVSSGGGGVVA